MEKGNLTEMDKLRLHRLSFFSDAILAILITLLLVDLKLPELVIKNSPTEMLEKILCLFPHLGSFLICFLTISQAWFSYNILFSQIIKYDHYTGALTMLALIPTCFFPFADGLIGEYYENPMGFVFLGVVTSLSSIIHYLLYRHLFKNTMISEKIDYVRFKRFVRTSAFIPFVLLLCGFMAFINATLSLFMFSIPIIIKLKEIRNLRA